MKINWKVRVKNKMFWVALVPAIFLLIQTICNVFGFSFDFTNLSNNILSVVDAIFSLLVICGVVIDPTTKGMSDSERALNYKELK